MEATYGFRATLTAHPGKGDELVRVLLKATKGSGPATSENCLAYIFAPATCKDLVYVTEGWTTKKKHAEVFASENARSLAAKIAPLVSDAQYQNVVPLRGLLRNGATS